MLECRPSRCKQCSVSFHWPLVNNKLLICPFCGAEDLHHEAKRKKVGTTEGTYVQIGDLPPETESVASASVSTNPFSRNMTNAEWREASSRTLNIVDLREIRRKCSSRHCDVCGHSESSIKCGRCPATFHPRCLNMKEDAVVPKSWRCFGCTAEAVMKKCDRADKLAKDRPPPTRQNEARNCRHRQRLMLSHDDISGSIASPRRTSSVKVEVHVSVDNPRQCTSCGYYETETIDCELSCRRTFCLGCACLARSTVPANDWTCPECTGVVLYDQQQAESMRKLREHIISPAVVSTDKDGFSQLLFDMLSSCVWITVKSNLDTLIQTATDQIERGQCPCLPPFHSLHYPVGLDFMRRISTCYSAAASKEVDSKTKPSVLWNKTRLCSLQEGTRLRIGYASSDFVNHPTADLIMSALKRHDVKKMQIFLYSFSKDDQSSYRKELEKTGTFRNIPPSMSNRKAANMIAEDEIHILVNLNGHTAGERNAIFALQPAPIQVAYLGFPGTMGAPYIQYNLADKVVVPDEHLSSFSETVLRMPHCYQTNSFRELYPEIVAEDFEPPTRKSQALPQYPTIVFCNFCRLGRITQDLFAVWMNILKRVPNSVLWLYKHPRVAALRLHREARVLGVQAERIIFAGPMSPKQSHLQRLCVADLYLDTTVYNGHTTGSDALWAGVPMVTLEGNSWASRVGSSLAHAVGLKEMVVHSLPEYEERAVALASNPSVLHDLRHRLHTLRRTAPLFDTSAWISSWEHACGIMWNLHVSNEQRPVCIDFAADRTHQVMQQLPAVTPAGVLHDIVTADAHVVQEDLVSQPEDRSMQTTTSNNNGVVAGAVQVVVLEDEMEIVHSNDDSLPHAPQRQAVENVCSKVADAINEQVIIAEEDAMEGPLQAASGFAVLHTAAKPNGKCPIVVGEPASKLYEIDTATEPATAAVSEQESVTEPCHKSVSAAEATQPS